jgi:hypothetical protein
LPGGFAGRSASATSDRLLSRGPDVLFKVDYFDPAIEFSSEDPADLADASRIVK